LLYNKCGCVINESVGISVILVFRAVYMTMCMCWYFNDNSIEGCAYDTVPSTYLILYGVQYTIFCSGLCWLCHGGTTWWIGGL